MQWLAGGYFRLLPVTNAWLAEASICPQIKSEGQRGYSRKWLKEKRQVRWEDRAEYLNGEGIGKRDRGTGSVPLVIERRPGMEEWWRRIRNLGMDTGWTGEWIEDRVMPTRVYKVEKSTTSLKGFMKGVKR